MILVNTCITLLIQGHDLFLLCMMGLIYYPLRQFIVYVSISCFCYFLKVPERERERDMRNAFRSHLHRMGNSYLHLLLGESVHVIDGKRRKESNESRNKNSPSAMCQWPSQRADERVEWKTVLEGGLATSWATAWIFGKEMGILSHFFLSELKNNGISWEKMFRNGGKKKSENHKH